MIDWTKAELPAGAARIDRLTFPLWKWWHRSLRDTLGDAFRAAFALTAVLAAVMFLAQVTFFGAWGIAAAVIIVAGITGGLIVRARNGPPRVQRSASSQVTTVLLALPLAIVMLSVAQFAILAATSLAIVPASNYGLPVLVLGSIGAIAVGITIARWRKREAARYPQPLT